MHPGDFMQRRTIDFCGTCLAVTTTESSFTYMTPKGRPQTFLHYLHTGSGKYHMERPTADNMSSVLSSNQMQTESRITKREELHHLSLIIHPVLVCHFKTETKN